MGLVDDIVTIHRDRKAREWSQASVLLMEATVQLLSLTQPARCRFASGRYSNGVSVKLNSSGANRPVTGCAFPIGYLRGLPQALVQRE